jgi:hypothetical protein
MKAAPTVPTLLRWLGDSPRRLSDPAARSKDADYGCVEWFLYDRHPPGLETDPQAALSPVLPAR